MLDFFRRPCLFTLLSFPFLAASALPGVLCFLRPVGSSAYKFFRLTLLCGFSLRNRVPVHPALVQNSGIPVPDLLGTQYIDLHHDDGRACRHQKLRGRMQSQEQIQKKEDRNCGDQADQEKAYVAHRQFAADLACLTVDSRIGDTILVPEGQEPDRQHGGGAAPFLYRKLPRQIRIRQIQIVIITVKLMEFQDLLRDLLRREILRILLIHRAVHIGHGGIAAGKPGGGKLLCVLHLEGSKLLADGVVEGRGRVVGQVREA